MLENKIERLQGVHGEALLCKSFYLIRSTFECGEREVAANCDASAVSDLVLVKDEMSSLGEEEGCPREEPANLDAILAVAPARPTLPAPRIARPLHPSPATPQPLSGSPLSPQGVPLPVQPHLQMHCDGRQQQQFLFCLFIVSSYKIIMIE